MNANEVIRYLFYTQNQLSDHFPSGRPQRFPYADEWYDGDNDLPNGSNQYLLTRYQILGAPPNSPQYTFNYQTIADETFNFCIRATATLFYWFTLETDMLPNTIIVNSFGGGKIKVNVVDWSSSSRIPAWNPQTTTLEAINQPYEGCYWLFQNWQKIVNGNVVQTFTSRSITITPEANTIYRANFIQQSPGFYLTSSQSTIFRNQTATFTIKTSIGYSGYSDYTWQTYKVAFRNCGTTCSNTCYNNICWEWNQDLYDGLSFTFN
ncbi:MAG: hypothetical protein QME25_09945, partial [Bacteroidota bacterium]|nr:hypothetical protein [Bacteroidota bacterium]